MASQVEIPDLEEIPDEVEDLPEEPEKEEVKPQRIRMHLNWK